MKIDPWVFPLAALLLLTVPLNWLMAAFAAAFVHELCHMTAIRLSGLRIHGLTIGTGGAVIDTEPMDDRQELFCALAGPLGSFSLILLFRLFPRLAICAAVQGLFNVLPVWPLDGGRVLRCSLRIFFPSISEKTRNGLELAVIFCLAGAWMTAALRPSLSTFPFIILILLCLKWFQRKKPCKRVGIRVQ